MVRRACLERGCYEYAIPPASRCQMHKAEREKARNARRPVEMGIYGSAAWKRLRAAVLREATGCAWCGATGVRLTADHVLTVRRAPDLALEPSNVVASCVSCQLRRQYAPGGGRAS